MPVRLTQHAQEAIDSYTHCSTNRSLKQPLQNIQSPGHDLLAGSKPCWRSRPIQRAPAVNTPHTSSQHVKHSTATGPDQARLRSQNNRSYSNETGACNCHLEADALKMLSLKSLQRQGPQISVVDCDPALWTGTQSSKKTFSPARHRQPDLSATLNPASRW